LGWKSEVCRKAEGGGGKVRVVVLVARELGKEEGDLATNKRNGKKSDRAERGFDRANHHRRKSGANSTSRRRRGGSLAKSKKKKRKKKSTINEDARKKRG